VVVGDDVAVARKDDAGAGTLAVGLFILALLALAIALSLSATKEIAEEIFEGVDVIIGDSFAGHGDLDVNYGIDSLFGGVGEVDGLSGHALHATLSDERLGFQCFVRHGGRNCAGANAEADSGTKQKLLHVELHLCFNFLAFNFSVNDCLFSLQLVCRTAVGRLKKSRLRLQISQQCRKRAKFYGRKILKKSHI